MKIVNSAYMSQGQAVPSKIYRPPKNNYILMYLFSINTHTFTYPALPKAISCKQYYSWPMMFSLSLFSKKTWRQWRTCISWARDCVNINWGLELLEHTTYGAYNSVVTVHVQNDALATRCEPSLYYKKKNKARSRHSLERQQKLNTSNKSRERHKNFMIDFFWTNKIFSYRISVQICTSAFKFQCKL